MPQPLKTKFKPNIRNRTNKGLQSFRNFVRYNKGDIIGGSVMAVMVGGLATIAGMLIYEGEEASTNNDFHNAIVSDINEANLATLQNQFFEVANPNTIIHTNGEIEYHIDFGTGIIAVDGPGEADTTYTFSNFPSPDLIARAQQAGLQIADTFNTKLDVLLSDDELEWLDSDGGTSPQIAAHLEETRTNIANFASIYGEPIDQPIDQPIELSNPNQMGPMPQDSANTVTGPLPQPKAGG